jgi:glutathione synthase/RimK-type ligase-like ATP-grasp enzyme
MKKIAFITCSKRPDVTPDDQILADALIARNCSVRGVPWDSKTVSWRDFDCLIIRSTWDYHLRSHEFLQWIENAKAKNLPLVNSPDTVRWNMNKKYLFELASQGVAIPRGVFVRKEERETLLQELMAVPADKFVVKPAVSATAYKTHVVSGDEPEKTILLAETLFDHGDVIVQEFIDEIQSQGEMSLMYFGGQFSHAVLKQAKQGDFRVQGEFGGTVNPFVPDASIVKQANSIVEKIPGCVYARVDGLDLKGKFVLMELELIEPVLFFSQSSTAAPALANAILSKIQDLNPKS